MRRLASRFLLAGLVAAILVLIIFRAGEQGGTLVSIDSVSAESDVKHRAFRVNEPMRVAIEASGSFETGGGDTTLAAHGWIVHRETGRVIWRMRPAQRPARGSYILMRDTLDLQPGIYDAVYAGLGDPLVRPEGASGGGIGSRINDFLSRGGRGWISDADRWRFIVTPATDADRGLSDRLDTNELDEKEGAIWATGRARSRTEYETTLRATESVRVQIDAVFEATPEAVADSAYVISAAGDTLWVARYEGSAWAGGSLKNRRMTDTLSLEPGLYRVAYRADRDHASGSWTANPPWQPWLWGLRVVAADSASASGAIAPLDPLRDFPRIVDIECAGEDADLAVQFDVTEALEVLVIGVGEFIDDSSYDFGTLSREGTVIWDMRTDTRTSAGGASKNQRAEETLTLEPGTYTLRYETDGSHHCGSFNSGSPDPEDFWGVLVLSADGLEAGDRVTNVTIQAPEAPEPDVPSGSLGPFPPEDILTSLTGIGNDRSVSGQFQLSDSTDVCVLSVGEISQSQRNDWARLATAEDATLWEMTRENTVPAGGAFANRLGATRLRLGPGRYTAHYETDSSHAPGSWVIGEPNRPGLWGVQVWKTPETGPASGDGLEACVLPGMSFREIREGV